MLFRFLSAFALSFIMSGSLPVSAAETLVPISAFVKVSKYSQPRLSPDGKYLAVEVTQEIDGRDTKLMTVYELASFKPVSTMRLPIFELPLHFYWVSNTRLVVVKGQAAGYLEQPIFLGEIIATDFDGQNQQYLYGYRRTSYRQGGAATAGDDYGWGDVHRVPRPLNGKFFLRERKWDKGRALADRTLLYEVDANTAIRKLAADVGAKDMKFLLQQDSTPRIAFGPNINNREIAFLRDKSEDKWIPVSNESLGRSFVPLAFTPDDQDFYLMFSAKGEPAALMRQSINTGERKLVASDKVGDLDMIQYGPGNRQPFAVASRIGIPTVQYIDENSPEAKLHAALSKQFPGQYVDFASFSADGKKLLFIVSSDREPGEYYLFDRDTKSADFLVATHPSIDASRMAERKPIHFTARDGLEIHGFLTLPPARKEGKLPMVLLPHGGPIGVADDWFWDADAAFLASRGYVVLQVNYRGSGGRGEGFLQAGFRQWATGMQHDLVDGVRWIETQGLVDPARVCVYGGSFGAYASMMTAIQEPDMFKCAVGYAGLYDLPMLLTGEKAKRFERTFNFWSEAMGNDLESLKKDSPTFLADKIKVPVLLVHGEKDETTPPEQAEAMRKALKNANKDFEWMMVPREGHGFYAEKNRIAFYEKLEAFLAKNLGP